MLRLLLSWSGIGAGYVLGHIAQEEISPGRKYFLLFRNFIFIVLMILTIYFLRKTGKIALPIAVLILGIVLFVSSVRKHRFYVPYFLYLLLGVPYFFLQQEQQSLLALLLFIYGLPLGTLLYERKKQES